MNCDRDYQEKYPYDSPDNVIAPFTAHFQLA